MDDSKTEHPERFEHYRVMTDENGKPIKLGEGAMGVTYLAEDTNLRVKVALKVIAPNLLGDTEIVQRFQREAQAAARLRHPNVAAVYHLGMVDDTFFYTMEFVEGRTLREHIAENGPMTVPQALAVTLQMCDALGAAEKHQMVHRDIKPANIMLETTDDGGLNAKLIDFGLAKPLQQDAQQTSALLTQRGTFLGTAVFASPEQVQDLPLDTRSDFYALGLTFWVMLEGRPPFEGSLHKVLYDQVHTKPPLDRLLWVPAEVRGFLAKMLEKEPSDRPQTARELRQMIHDCQRAMGTGTGQQADWQKRFQVRKGPRAQAWGTIYEGQDTLSGEVWLHFLRSDRFSDSDMLNRVIASIRRAIEIHHPNVLRHVTVFPGNDAQGDAGWVVVTEHPGAHTLLGHLQQVKQLPAAEAFPLIERLAEALDCCLANDLPSADLDPGRIYLKPQTSPGKDGPVEVVPKLIPLNYNFPSSVRAGDETAFGLTQIVSRGEVRSAQDAVQRLATLAYQCLGGSWGRMTRYIPLPGLTQHQNETLRVALAEKKYSHASEFIEALRQTKLKRKTAVPSTSEATVTLSPWERLAAIASVAESAKREIEPISPPAEGTASVYKTVGIAPPSQPSAPPTQPADEPETPIESQIILPPEAAPEQVEAEEALPPVEEEQEAFQPAAEEEPVTSSASATSSSVRTTATELPLSNHPSQAGRTSAIAALRKTMEREWRDAKPMIDKVATPVRESVKTLPRWVFVAFGCFVAVVGVVLWAIANRDVPSPPSPPPSPPPQPIAEADPGTQTKKSSDDLPPPPPPPVTPPIPSLDQLLTEATKAATDGKGAELLGKWQEIKKKSPDGKWNSLTTSAPFIDAVTKAWEQDRLGEPAKATSDYLDIVTQSAKRNEVPFLKKLSANLEASQAERFELRMLDTLSETSDKGGKEQLLDESLRLVQTRKTGAVATRARDLIRQTLEPLVTFRERWKRPPDMDAALRIAMTDLSSKFEALAATDEPTALYLYADKLRTDGRLEDSVAQFEKAGDLGHVPSMLQAGLLRSNTGDLQRAVTWFKLADGKGYPQAAYALGECYLYGTGVKRDYDLALNRLEASAAEDIAEAHTLLGETYLGHTPGGLPPDNDYRPENLNPKVTGDARITKAREHFEKAVQHGSAISKGLLAGLMIEGAGGPRDIARGVKLLDEVCQSEKPDPVFLRNYAYILMPNLPSVMPFTRADLDAANVKPDAKRAEMLMRQAARAKDPWALKWCKENGVTH